MGCGASKQQQGGEDATANRTNQQDGQQASRPAHQATPPPPPPHEYGSSSDYCFRVKVIGGLNLYNNGFGARLKGSTPDDATHNSHWWDFTGRSDPYVRLGIRDPKSSTAPTFNFRKTSVVTNDQNPVWNEEFYFSIPDLSSSVLDLTVYDAELGREDEHIGTATLPLVWLVDHTKEREYWVPMEGSKSSGEVGISIIRCYRMDVLVKEGQHLVARDRFSGTSDCYLTVDLGQQKKQKSETIPVTLNPKWNQNFQFFVPYGSESQLQFVLWDADKLEDDSMGWVTVDIDGVPQKEARDLKLKVLGAKGHLLFQLKDVPESCAAATQETDLMAIAPTTAGGSVLNSVDKSVDLRMLEAGDETSFAVMQPNLTAEQKADPKTVFLPPTTPQTVTFICHILGCYNLGGADQEFLQNARENSLSLQHTAAQTNQFMYKFLEQGLDSAEPFVQLECEGQVYDTPKIQTAREPRWNTKMRMIGRDRHSSSLAVSVWDKSVLKETPIGNVKLPLKEMKPGDRTELWSFFDQGRGEVGLALNLDYQLKVSVHRAFNLPAKDIDGMTDSYVEVSLNAKTHRTRVVHNSRSPWFEEDFRFTPPVLDGLNLYFEVFDADLTVGDRDQIVVTKDPIGVCEVPLDFLQPGIPMHCEEHIVLKENRRRSQGKLQFTIMSEVPLPSRLQKLLDAEKREFRPMVEIIRDQRAALDRHNQEWESSQSEGGNSFRADNAVDNDQDERASPARILDYTHQRPLHHNDGSYHTNLAVDVEAGLRDSIDKMNKQQEENASPLAREDPIEDEPGVEKFLPANDEQFEMEPVRDFKMSKRPRFTRLKAMVLEARHLTGCGVEKGEGIFVTISVPTQGQMEKSIFTEYGYLQENGAEDLARFATNEMNFRVPSMQTAGIRVSLYKAGTQAEYDGLVGESLKEAPSLATRYIPFRKMRGGQGLSRGAGHHEMWFYFREGGAVKIRLFEPYRYNIRLLGAEGLPEDAKPFVWTKFNDYFYKSHAIRPKKVRGDEKNDMSEGVAGKPVWDDQYTFFGHSKEGQYCEFSIRDGNSVVSTELGTCKLHMADLEKGKEMTLSLPFWIGKDEKASGLLHLWAREEADAVLDSTHDGTRRAEASKLEEEDEKKKTEQRKDEVLSGLDHLFRMASGEIPEDPDKEKQEAAEDDAKLMGSSQMIHRSDSAMNLIMQSSVHGRLEKKPSKLDNMTQEEMNAKLDEGAWIG